MHEKAWRALHLENPRGLMYWTWDVDGMLVPDSTLIWNLPKSHCPASDRSVLGKWAQLDTGPVGRPGFSFVFSSWPALTGTRRDWCAGHNSWWSFQGLSLLGPCYPKRKVAMDMKDGWNLAPCHQQRGLQPVLPYSAHSQTCFSQVQPHRSALEPALAQMSIERRALDAQADRSGNGIGTQAGKYRRVPKKLGLCALAEFTAIQIFILLLAWGKRRLREETGLIISLAEHTKCQPLLAGDHCPSELFSSHPFHLLQGWCPEKPGGSG